MNKDFFRETENECWQKLLHFNDEVGCFQSLERLQEKSSADASGVTKDGREVLIELKSRNQNYMDNGTISGATLNGHTYTASTLFIEPHKAAELFLTAIPARMEPLYINFLESGCTVIFNLLKLKNKVVTQQKKIESKGYGQFEISARYGLSIKDAAIYKNKELIQRP